HRRRRGEPSGGTRLPTKILPHGGRYFFDERGHLRARDADLVSARPGARHRRELVVKLAARRDAAELLRGGIVVVFATTTAVYNTTLPVADNDLWGHVYFGRLIVAGKHL